MEEILFWVIQGIKKARATNHIMNLRQTLYVVADAEVLCSIPCSSGNIQIKTCWGSIEPSSVRSSWEKPQ